MSLTSEGEVQLRSQHFQCYWVIQLTGTTTRVDDTCPCTNMHSPPHPCVCVLLRCVCVLACAGVRAGVSICLCVCMFVLLYVHTCVRVAHICIHILDMDYISSLSYSYPFQCHICPDLSTKTPIVHCNHLQPRVWDAGGRLRNYLCC